MSDSLTPEEQRFFETGQLQPGMPGATTTAAPAPEVVDPLALAALGTAPAPAPASAAPAPAPVESPAQAPAPAQPPATSNELAEVLRRSLAEAQQRAAELEHKLASSTQQPKTPDPGPDPVTDPLGAMLHQIDSVNKRVADLQTALEVQQNQSAQVNQFQQFQQQLNTLKAEFVKTTPDFNEAYAHLRNTRAADLRTFGIPEANIPQQLFQEEVALAESAIRNGRNPAEVVYEMSKRHGYTPKVTPPPPSQNDLQNKLANIRQAADASKQLPKAITHDADLTIESIRDASDDDINKLVMDSKAWAKLTGSDQYPL